LEKIAGALEVPLYRFFYDGKEPPKKPDSPPGREGERTWGTKGKQLREVRKFAKAFSRMDERKRKLLIAMAQYLAKKTG
jgi:hypothetical protein